MYSCVICTSHLQKNIKYNTIIYQQIILTVYVVVVSDATLARSRITPVLESILKKLVAVLTPTIAYVMPENCCKDAQGKRLCK